PLSLFYQVQVCSATGCDTAFCKAWSAPLSIFVARQTRRGKAFACHHVQQRDRMNANALPLPTLSARTAALWLTTMDRPHHATHRRKIVCYTPRNDQASLSE